MTKLKSLVAPIQTPLQHFNGHWIKAENKQRYGCVKYRLVYQKLSHALSLGLINDDTILTEVSAGSTGLVLASIGQELGLKVEIHCYDDSSPVKLAEMKQLGATLCLHPKSESIESILGEVEEKVERGQYWHLDQYDKDSVRRSYEGLAAEFISQLKAVGARPNIFLCPVGTGGVIQGVGAAIRRVYPYLPIIALEPSLTNHIDGLRNTQFFHMGLNDPYDIRFPDARVEVDFKPCPVTINDMVLGESTSATLEVAERKGWDKVCCIAAD